MRAYAPPGNAVKSSLFGAANQPNSWTRTPNRLQGPKIVANKGFLGRTLIDLILKPIRYRGKENVIKVLKSNYNSEPVQSVRPHAKEDYKFTCERCGSELEYILNDVDYNSDNQTFVKCPCCGREILVDEVINTPSNFLFPNDFFDTSKAVHVQEDVVNKRIRDGIDYLRDPQNKDEWLYFSSCGDTFIVIMRLDEDENYNVYVSQDFYDTFLEYEDKDYQAYGIVKGSHGKSNGREMTYRISDAFHPTTSFSDDEMSKILHI